MEMCRQAYADNEGSDQPAHKLGMIRVFTVCKQNHWILKNVSMESRPRGYKTFFMLNSAEHEIFSANKYENANNSWHFHIY